VIPGRMLQARAARAPTVAFRGPFRLGQSDSLLREVARNVVAEADPRVRDIISEERTRVAQAAKLGLPFAALSGLAFLGTTYAVPVEARSARVVGYAASAGFLGLSLWLAVDRLADVRPEPAGPGGGGPTGGLLTAVAQPLASQLAQAVVSEAEPRVRAIVADEKAKLSSAGKAVLPWAAAGAAALAGTMFLVPDKLKIGKAAGYAAGALLVLIGAWKGLDEGEGVARVPA